MSSGIPSVVMVTGAYYPELSGAGLQCRALIRAFGDRVRCRVLTTAVDPALPAVDVVDGVPVRRVLVSAVSRAARALAAPQLLVETVRAARAADIVHLHGFSAKSRLIVAVARLLRKRVVIKLTSVGHSRKLHERIPGSTLIECDDAGHMVMIERHGQVNADLDQLLSAAAERVEQW